MLKTSSQISQSHFYILFWNININQYIAYMLLVYMLYNAIGNSVILVLFNWHCFNPLSVTTLYWCDTKSNCIKQKKHNQAMRQRKDFTRLWRLWVFSLLYTWSTPHLVLQFSVRALWVEPTTASNETNYISYQSIVPSNWTNIKLIDLEHGTGRRKVINPSPLLWAALISCHCIQGG